MTYKNLLIASVLISSVFTGTAMANGPLPDNPFGNKDKGVSNVTTNSNVSGPLIVVPPPVLPDASAYVIMDYTTGQVLAADNANLKIWPASLTKMMTSYVIGTELKAGRLSLDDEVVIPQEAWAKNYTDSSKMFIEVGKKIKVGDLNKGIIIQSGNDACMAMAYHLAGNEAGFVSVMNQYAQALGLNHTHFANVHGLFDENNYSTAYDMSKLAQALIRDLPNEYAVYSQKEFTFNGIKQYNRNKLLWDQSLQVDGVKTGHLSEVGYNLVASAVENNTRLIATVIGAKSESQRASYAKQLLTYGFANFEHYSPFKDPQQTIITGKVRMGDTNSVELISANPVIVSIPKGGASQMKVNYKLDKATFIAPIKKGQKLGELYVYMGDKALGTFDLVAKNEVKEGSFFSKLIDRVMMFFTE